MKRISMRSICLIMVLIFLAASVLPAFASEKKRAHGAFRVVVEHHDERLNVHETPEGGRDNVIDRLKEGTVVLALESVKGWWHIQWWKGHDDLEEGYVDNSFLEAIDADPNIVYTCVDNSYIHSVPCLVEGECAFYHIDKLMVGTKVKVLEQERTWARISYNGTSGWIASKYLVQVL